MRDELDGELLRRFTEAEELLPAEPFALMIATRLGVQAASVRSDALRRLPHVIIGALWLGLLMPWRQRFAATAAATAAAAASVIWMVLA